MGDPLTANEICTRLTLKREAKALLRDAMPAGEYAAALVTNKQYVTGIEYVAQALPLRESIWWGCLCVREVYGDDLSGADKEACKAAVKWLIEPTEENRLACRQAAQAAGAPSPAALVAAAVFQTGGNPAIPNAPTPDVAAPGRAVANAVKLLCTKRDPVKIVETQRLFVELGMGRV